MLIAQLSDVSKAFGSQEVLEGIHWQIPETARIALVGRNGSGKTTLFRILSGEVEPDRGSVWRRAGSVIAITEQEVRVEDRRTLRDEAASGLAHLEELHREFESVTRRMGSLEEGDPESQALLDRYAHLQERLEREGGYAFEARVKAVLAGLHFEERDLDRPLAEFSGGQKSRAMLARVLLRDPDLLLLDEPTNHLDLDAIEWLEGFLQSYGGAYLVVSHDRMFLNRVAGGVAEIRYRKLHQFNGNYDAFLVERERRLQEQAKKYELQRTEIARQEDFIRRNIAGQKTKQAQARRKMLARLERVEAPEWPASSIRMRLPEPDRTGRMVVEAEDLAKSYGEVPVFRGVSFQLQRGEKFGLIGPNGVGKTTLVRILVGEESQTGGKLRIGTGVQVGYAEQEQRRLTGSQSILDEVWKITPQVTEGEMRTFLGGFLFQGEDVFKPLNALSGGEKSRVALAKLVREGANFLVLDEPTNHLDIESREVIEAALRAFQGSALVVSHDRYFLDRVVDHVLELHENGCRVWRGGYSAYARQAVTTASSQAREPSAGREVRDEKQVEKEVRVQDYQEQKRRRREEERLEKRLLDAEQRVGELERRRENLLLEMADPILATDSARLEVMSRDLSALDTEIREAISAWEALELRLQAFLDGPK